MSINKVDAYFDQLNAPQKVQMETLRSLIKEVIPDIEERLSWGAPTYYHDGYLLQIAAYKHHVGFYTTPAVITHFKEALSSYKTNEKNTVQFPLEEELPLDLIKAMLLYRLQEHQQEKH